MHGNYSLRFVDCRSLRASWDELAESLQKEVTATDQSLQKFVEFSAAKDEFNAWIEGLESLFAQSTELYCTLPEKQTQLQVFQNFLFSLFIIICC